MNQELLSKFQEWCEKKAKIAKGTTLMYIKYLKYTETFSLKDDYSTIYKKLYKRINSNPERYAHLKFLKFLKDKTSDFEMKKTGALVINEISEITIGKRRNTAVNVIKEKVLTKEQLKILYEYVKNIEFSYPRYGERHRYEKYEIMQNILLIRYLLETAGRAEEVRRYERFMINKKKKTIEVPKELTKRNKSRTAEISETTVEMTIKYEEELLKNGIKEQRIFFNFKTYSQLLRFIKKIGEKAIHKNLTPHCFRHTFCTLKTIKAIEKGVNKAIIKEKLRDYLQHSSTLTTEIYIKIAEDFERERILELYGELL